MKIRRARDGELSTTVETPTSPRALALAKREEQLRRALNEAATRPSSEVVIIEPDADERLSTIRSSLARLLRDEPRDLVWGVRNGYIVIAKDRLPPRRVADRR